MILNQLRKLIRQDERSARQIAIAAEIHPVTFNAFTSGRRGLSIDSAEKLAAVLGHPLTLKPGKKGKR